MQAFVEVMSDGSEHVLYNRPGFAVFTRRERMSAFSKGRVLCHWHEDLEFLAVRQGRMRYSVNGEFFEIGEGEGLFINSCHMHSFECLRGADCAFSSLLVHPSVLGANAYLRENFVRPLSRNDAIACLTLNAATGWQETILRDVCAACEIMERFSGLMPASVQELLTLPGIGPYTAGAISSIAYGRPAPAVDGNVLRVMARFRMDGRDMANQKVRKSVEEDLSAAIPVDRPGDFNQAMMEIGAMVCLPNGAPHCGECPLAEVCMAHEEGRELDYPKKAPKKQRTVEEKTVLVILDERKAAFRKRPDTGLLAGMYELPALEGKKKQAEVLGLMKEKGLNPIRIRKLPAAKHIFTHKEWHMTGYAVWVDELEPYEGGWEGLIFADRRDLDEIPVPSAFAAYLDYVKSNM